MKSKRGQDVLVRFVVGVAGNTVVGSRTVEFGKKQGLAFAVIESARQKHAEAVKLMAISRPTLISAKASRLKRRNPVAHRRTGIYINFFGQIGAFFTSELPPSVSWSKLSASPIIRDLSALCFLSLQNYDE